VRASGWVCAMGVVVVAMFGCAGAGAPDARSAPAPDGSGTAAPAPAPSPSPSSPAPGAKLRRIEVESDLGAGAVARTVHTHVYDASGRLVEKRVGDGAGPERVEHFAYDAEGRVVAVSHSSGGLGMGGSETRAYDGKGRLVRTCSFQEVGVLAVMPNNACEELSYDDATGRVIEERSLTFSSREVPQGQPWGAVQVSYEQDASGRVIAEHREQSGKRINTRRFEYDASGRVTQETFDALHTPELEEKKTFTYDADGSLAKMVRTRAGTSGTGRATYEYARGVLVRAHGALIDEARRYTDSAKATYVYASPSER
jgi:YD repeat-containing protein